MYTPVSAFFKKENPLKEGLRASPLQWLTASNQTAVPLAISFVTISFFSSFKTDVDNATNQFVALDAGLTRFESGMVRKVCQRAGAGMCATLPEGVAFNRDAPYL